MREKQSERSHVLFRIPFSCFCIGTLNTEGSLYDATLSRATCRKGDKRKIKERFRKVVMGWGLSGPYVGEGQVQYMRMALDHQREGVE